MRRPRLRKLLRRQSQELGPTADINVAQAIDNLRGDDDLKNPVIQVSHFVRVLKQVDEMLMQICGLFVQPLGTVHDSQSKAVGGAETGKHELEKHQERTISRRKANVEGNATAEAIRKEGRNTALPPLKQKEKMEHASERPRPLQAFPPEVECSLTVDNLIRKIEMKQMQRVVALSLEPSLAFSTLRAQAFKATTLLNRVQPPVLSLPSEGLHQTLWRRLWRSVRDFECDNRSAGRNNGHIKDDGGTGRDEARRGGWSNDNDANDIDNKAMLDVLVERRYFIIGQISVRDWHRWFSIISFEVRSIFILLLHLGRPHLSL